MPPKEVIVVCFHPKKLLIGHDDVMLEKCWFVNDLTHVKNGVSYMQPWFKLTWLSIVEMIHKKCKLLQFVYILHLLSEGHLMKVDYEGMKPLFKQLWINNYPHKHCSNSLGWIMGKHMHNVMLDTMQWPMAKVKVLSISCEEIKNIDNQTWTSVHVYVVQEWCKVPILFF